VSNARNRGVRWAIAVIAMVMLLWYVGPSQFLATLAEMDLRFVSAYFAAFLAVPFIYGLQLHGALRIGGYAPALGSAVSAAVSSWSVGTITPARAGDLTLAYFLGDAVKPSDAHALVAVDKAISLVVLAALAIASAPLIPDSVAAAVMIGSGLVLVAAMLGFLMLRAPVVDSPLRAVAKRLLGATAEQSWTALQQYSRNARLLLWSTLMATLRWSYIAVTNVLIFRAVDAAPDIATILAATSVGRIISIVPVSIGGLGVKEPVQIVIYNSVGVSAASVMAVSIVGLACGFLVAAVAPLIARPLASTAMQKAAP
jgi:uncharacterized protein (TIRG00374 family)